MAKKQKVEYMKGDIAWVNYTLSEAELASLEGYKLTVAQMFTSASELVQRGYRFTATYDFVSNCYMVTVLCFNKNDANYGLGLSSRSDDMVDAWLITLYKHYELFAENWPKSNKRTLPTRG